MNASDCDLSSLTSCRKVDIDNLPDMYFSHFSNDLTILNVNIRSLNSNFNLLTSFLSQIGILVKVIVITESYLDDCNAHLFNLNGYRKMYLNRPTLGGGIIAYIHNSLDFEVNAKLTAIYDTHESLTFTLRCPGKVDINFMCIYRPPSKSLASFVGFLEAIPNRTFKKKYIILGDLNVCPARDGCTSGYRDLENFLLGRNFNQLVQFPTYTSYDGNMSTLDHVRSNIISTSICFVFQTPICA